jgi:hypothetical protein
LPIWHSLGSVPRWDDSLERRRRRSRTHDLRHFSPDRVLARLLLFL